MCSVVSKHTPREGKVNIFLIKNIEIALNINFYWIWKIYTFMIHLKISSEKL